jgi:hypothetical protein
VIDIKVSALDTNGGLSVTEITDFHKGGPASAPFLKYGTQKSASDASSVSANGPTPRVLIDG